MRAAWSVLLGMALMFAFVVGVRAEDKEVKLKGKIACAKCQYNLVKSTGIEKPEACKTVLLVPAKKKGGKATLYVFDADSHKKFHGKICKAAKSGTVTGTVTKEGDENVIHVTDMTTK